jgi:hypothetical protein
VLEERGDQESEARERGMKRITGRKMCDSRDSDGVKYSGILEAEGNTTVQQNRGGRVATKRMGLWEGRMESWKGRVERSGWGHGEREGWFLREGNEVACERWK